MRGKGELATREKYNHQAVDYQQRSSHPGQRCSNCSMYIDAVLPRCTIVLRPIHPTGWCRKWEHE